MGIEELEQLLLNENYSKAEEVISTFSEPEKSLWLGWLLLFRDGLDAALSYSVQKISEHRNDPEFWSFYAWVQLQNGSGHIALAAYKRSLGLKWTAKAFQNAIGIAIELLTLDDLEKLLRTEEWRIQISEQCKTNTEFEYVVKFANALLFRFQERAKDALILLNSIAIQRPEIFLLKGHIYRDCKLTTQALFAYEEGLGCFPDHPDLLRAKSEVVVQLPTIFSGALKGDGHLQERSTFEKRLYLEKVHGELLQRASDVPEVQHLHSALQGVNTEGPPEQYVKELFDDYAERFDSHLLEELQYQGPMLMELVVRNRYTADAQALSVWDLGCGTGLLGKGIRDVCQRLVGVDVSPKMLERAQNLGVYDELIQSDLVKFLQSIGLEYEHPALIIAVDTLVYIGNLEPLFAALASYIQKGATFMCTVEKPEHDGVCLPNEEGERLGYQIQYTGRYTHEIGYIRWLAEYCGFTLQKYAQVDLRQNSGTWIKGWLCVLGLPVEG